MKRTLKILGTLAIAVLILVACGNGGGSPTGEGDQSFNRVKEEGVLKVGIEGTYPPFSYHDENDELKGYDADVARAVAEELGVEVEFVEGPWDSLLSGLDAKQTDSVFNQVSYSEERGEKYVFPEAYTYVSPVVVVHEDNNDINEEADVDGKSSAQTMTSDLTLVAESLGAEIETITGSSEAFEMINSGRADLAIYDELSFYDYMNTHPDAPLKVAFEIDQTNELGSVVRKEDQELANAIDQAIKTLKEDGTLSQISETYFGVDISQENTEG